MGEKGANEVQEGKSAGLPKWLPWGILGTLLAAMALSFAKTSDAGLITAVAAWAQVLISAAGIFVIYLQIQEMSKSTQENTNNTKAVHEWNMRVESLKIASNRSSFVESFEAIQKCLGYGEKGNGLPKALDETKDEDAETIKHVKIIANYFEGIAAGIKHGAYDEDIMYDTTRGMLVRYYGYFDEFLSEKRSKLNNPRAWVEFRDLAARWEKRYKEELEQTRASGKPPVFPKK